MVKLCRLLLLCALACASAASWAHKGSDAYLDVRSEGASNGGLHLALAIAIKDLDQLAPLDADADGKVTWGEIKAATPAVRALLQANTSLNREQSASDTRCALQWEFDGLERRSDGGYLRFAAQASCSGAQVFRYTMFREQDATHRLIVTGRVDERDLLSTLSPMASDGLRLRAEQAALASGASAGGAEAVDSGLAALRVYLRMGMHHLLEGYDHLAFLLALVLPLRLAIRWPGVGAVRSGAGLARRGRTTKPSSVAVVGAGGGVFAFDAVRDEPVARPATAATPNAASRSAATAWSPSQSAERFASSATWLALLRTITAFTIGHSITLILATFGITQASPAWVEPTIALSIGVTALLNLYPLRHVRTDVLALLFGMVHGFGFAGLLTEAAAPTGLLPWALAGFNIGVECGQLFAVACWVLLSQLLVGRRWYGSVVVRGGSWALAALAAYWFWERVSP